MTRGNRLSHRAARMIAITCATAAPLVVVTASPLAGATIDASATESASTAAMPATTLDGATEVIPFPDLRNSQRVLAAGTYVTTTFDQPALTMTLPGRWTFFDQGPTDLQINEGSTFTGGLRRTMLTFNFFGQVIDPSDDKTTTETVDLIAWLEQNPHVEVIRPATTIEVAGVEAQEIDFRPIGAPDCSYWQDGSRCWNLMPIIDGDPFTPENRSLGTMFAIGSDPASPDVPFSYRLVLVDFGDSQVVFTWQDAQSSFDETVRSFDDVLASVQTT